MRLRFVVVLAACAPVEEQARLDTDGTSSGSDRGSEAGSDDGDPPAGGTEGADDGASGGGSGGGSEGGEGGTGDDDGETTGEGVSSLEVEWITEWDGASGHRTACTGAVDFGDEVVSTFYVEGLFALRGYSMTLGPTGEVEATHATEEGRYLTGLAGRDGGVFDWAASDGTTGIADTALVDLSGQPLGHDVAATFGLAARDGTRAVLAGLTTGACVVRRGADEPTDSVPRLCPDQFYPERRAMTLDAHGSAYVFDLWSYRATRYDAAGLQWGELEGRDGFVALDAAVTDDGVVWLAGGVGSPEALAGSFIARHDSVLEAEPSWETVAPRSPAVWTAIAAVEDGVVALGEWDGSVIAAGLDASGGVRWEKELELGVGLRMQRAVAGPQGRVIACGRRLVPGGSDPLEVAVVAALQEEQS